MMAVKIWWKYLPKSVLLFLPTVLLVDFRVLK
jgi:hypothetical protein